MSTSIVPNTVKEHYVSYGDEVYGCGDFAYQYKISSSGKITQKKLLKKEKLSAGQTRVCCIDEPIVWCNKNKFEEKI